MWIPIIKKLSIIKGLHQEISKKSKKWNPPLERRWRFTHLPIIIAHENYNHAHKNMRKVLTCSNLAYTVSLAQRQILEKYGFLCTLWPLRKARMVLWYKVQLAAIFFPMEDAWDTVKFPPPPKKRLRKFEKFETEKSLPWLGHPKYKFLGNRTWKLPWCQGKLMEKDRKLQINI